MPEEQSRPRTSTRDYEELRRRLTEWLGRQLPPGAEPVVSSLDVPSSNGMSSETVLFDLTTSGGDSPGTVSCVARIEPEGSAVPVFPTYDLAKQFRVMQLVGAETEVPVPRTLWLETDPAAVGAPFFVMERVEGQVPPDVVPYNLGSWVSEASPQEQSRLQESTIGVLTALHAVRADAVDLSFLELDRPGGSALRRHVVDQWAYYEWVAAGRRQPLIERCFAWLEDHWPADEGLAALSWGDARIGNILYRDFTPVAVLDWEMAAVGPPGIDVGWTIYLHRFFEKLAQQLGLPGMPNFMRRQDVAASYARQGGDLPDDLEFYEMYAALRHGIVMTRVTQRSIYFGEAEMPDDPDDLIMHRTDLEAMLTGTYWNA